MRCLGYLTVWGAGQPKPFVSTLNSPAGRVLANSAIVPAGTNGAISLYANLPTGATADVIIDVVGIFTSSGYSFYPLAPFRLFDSRNTTPFPGGPYTRTIQASFADTLPEAAALVLNATAVPAGPLDFLTLWQYGVLRPFVSTLNSTDGRIVSNGAIVRASTIGTSRAFNVFTVMDSSLKADVILDVNGIFGP